MKDPARFFRHPQSLGQRDYEVLRASFLERLPANVVAERFGMKPGHVHVLRHRFKRGQIGFTFRAADIPGLRRGTPAHVRSRITDLRRERGLSGGQIAEILEDDGTELSVRTVERILADAGFPKLPRRTRLLIGETRKRTSVPEVSRELDLPALTGMHTSSDLAGLFLFVPFIELLGLPAVVQRARLPGTKPIPALCYFLSLLALKLAGDERLSHINDHNFDDGLGLFAKLNRLPKCTAISTYGYSLDTATISRLQRAFADAVHRQGLYAGSTFNLDFHAVPHWGDQSVLDKNWVGARGKGIKSALTLFAQDCKSKLIVYTNADVRRREADDQVLQFVAFLNRVARSIKPTLVFDSRFTSYRQLAQLHDKQVRFITLRRRGRALIKQVEQLPASAWTRVTIEHEKRKFKRPQVVESHVQLRGYPVPIRQIVMRGNGHEKPSFLITNDDKAPVETIISQYAERWYIENGIAEAVKFFHINALSSPVLIKVHLDVVMTMIADTLYYMLAKRLRGFEECDAPRIFRNFIRGKGDISVTDEEIIVRFPKRAHNPVLRSVDWSKLPNRVSWLGNRRLRLEWR